MKRRAKLRIAKSPTLMVAMGAAALLGIYLVIATYPQVHRYLKMETM